MQVGADIALLIIIGIPNTFPFSFSISTTSFLTPEVATELIDTSRVKNSPYFIIKNYISLFQLTITRGLEQRKGGNGRNLGLSMGALLLSSRIRRDMRGQRYPLLIRNLGHTL